MEIKSKQELLAIAWGMPPLVYPRSIQISRALKELKKSGWNATVISVAHQADSSTVVDEEFGRYYQNEYSILGIEPREEIMESDFLRRDLRKISPVKIIKIDNWRIAAYKVAFK